MRFSSRHLAAFRRSPSLQRLADHRELLAREFISLNQKFVPVAKVARMLGVSSRLLWQWIAEGWLKTHEPPRPYPRSNKRILAHKKGITPNAFSIFLRRLQAVNLHADELLFPPSGLGRPPSASNRLRQACSTKKGVANGMPPRACAEAIGISADTVRRAIKSGAIRGHRPTPSRYAIGVKTRKRKKSK